MRLTTNAQGRAKLELFMTDKILNFFIICLFWLNVIGGTIQCARFVYDYFNDDVEYICEFRK
jgi:hypothetical protein